MTIIDTRDIKVTCPYCDHVNRVTIHRAEENRPKVVLCEIEDGPGCDRYFAVEVSFYSTIKIYVIHEPDAIIDLGDGQ